VRRRPFFSADRRKIFITCCLDLLHPSRRPQSRTKDDDENERPGLRGALEVIYAPKVATGLSPGFQPWNPQNNEFGLKGREADLISSHPLLRQKLECAIEMCYNWTIGPTFPLLVRSICRPFSFRANRSGWRFPGLKPWAGLKPRAEFSSPFGARPFGQTMRPGHRLEAYATLTPSPGRCGCTAIAPKIVLRDRSTVQKTISHSIGVAFSGGQTFSSRRAPAGEAKRKARFGRSLTLSGVSAGCRFHRCV